MGTVYFTLLIKKTIKSQTPSFFMHCTQGEDEILLSSSTLFYPMQLNLNLQMSNNNAMDTTNIIPDDNDDVESDEYRSLDSIA